MRLVGGLLLVLALLRPIAALRWEDMPALEAGSFSAQTEEQAQAYRQEQTDALSAIIAERLEAYIWDKGCELGLELAVTVTCAETGERRPPAGRGDHRRTRTARRSQPGSQRRWASPPKNRYGWRRGE